MILVGVPLYIQYRISGSPSANKPMPRAQSSWHHHHPTHKSKAQTKAQTKASQQASVKEANTPQANSENATAGNASTSTFTATATSKSSTATLTESPTQSAQSQSIQNQNFQSKGGESIQGAQQQGTEEESEVCCGLHEVCEKLATNPTKVEYFDDEELDAFRGRDPQSYNDSEIDLFRDVMTTMYPSEVALWRQSLQLRGVALPVELEDEFMLILSEV